VRLDSAFGRIGVLAALAGTLTMASAASVFATGAGTSASSRASGDPSRTAVATPFDVVVSHRPFVTPPTTAQCEASYGIPCYSPKQIETAYEMSSLYAKGDTGTGSTIVIVDSYGSPTIAADLATFDKGFGLAAPPSLKIITPAGKPPAYNGSSAMDSWATETSLDVEYSHAMAPGANILLVETPVNETVGTVGFSDIVKAENYVVKNDLGDVISQSFGAPEETFPSAASIESLRSAYKAAAKADVTVLAAAGDAGASGVENAAGTEYFTKRVIMWPASDPLVTAVGGTQLHLNAAGDRTAPDNVWNDTARLGEPAAGGGGVSSVFGRPSYQSSVSSVVGSWRGIPDVALSAAVYGAVLVYMSMPGTAPGYYPIGGTSEACPLFAGIVAIADQVAGHKLGQINPTLYALGSSGTGITDITKGNNTVTFTQSGKSYKVTGYTAVTGYDLASGLGTVDGAELVPELAAG
jgi:subtilase family serine protease